MSGSLIVSLLVALYVMFVLMKGTHIAGESERFAVFKLGRFENYQGPGLIIIVPFITQVIRLKVGDIGELSSSEFATFSKTQVPVEGTESLKVGTRVQISGFEDSGPRLVPALISQTNRCPKCGHEY